MENLHDLVTSGGFVALILIIALWDAVWRLIGLWRSARNGHLVWFICIAIFATAGILPIIYILMYRNSERHESV